MEADGYLSILPSQKMWTQFADPGGIEGMIGLGRKFEQKIGNWMNAICSASSDSASERSCLNNAQKAK